MHNACVLLVLLLLCCTNLYWILWPIWITSYSESTHQNSTISNAEIAQNLYANSTCATSAHCSFSACALCQNWRHWLSTLLCVKLFMYILAAIFHLLSIDYTPTKGMLTSVIMIVPAVVFWVCFIFLVCKRLLRNCYHSHCDRCLAQEVTRYGTIN